MGVRDRASPPPRVSEAAKELGDYVGAERQSRGLAPALLPSALLLVFAAVLLVWRESALMVAGGVLAVVVAVLALARPHPVAYCYTGGVVLHLVAHPWSALTPHQSGSWLELRAAPGGAVARFTGEVARRVSGLVAAASLPEAERRLAREGELRFGPIVLTGTGLVIGDKVFTWPEISRVRVDEQHLIVLRINERRPAGAVRADIPHERVLLTLVARHVETD